MVSLSQKTSEIEFQPRKDLQEGLRGHNPYEQYILLNSSDDSVSQYIKHRSFPSDSAEPYLCAQSSSWLEINTFITQSIHRIICQAQAIKEKNTPYSLFGFNNKMGNNLR